MSEIDISEELKPCPFCGGKPYLHKMLPKLSDSYVSCLHCDCDGPNKGLPDDAVAAWNSRSALTAAEAERDEALAQVAALRECIGAAIECGMVPKSTAKNGGAASYAHQTHVADMLRSALTDTAAAAREYRARVVEECAGIAASATITDHDNLSWTDGRRVAVEAIRAHAAKVREGE